MSDEVTQRLQRAAEELEVELQFITTQTDEDEVIQQSGLPNNIKTRTKLRKLVQQAAEPCFVVSGMVKGALRSQGARGNVYKALEHHQAFRSVSEGPQITYIDEDLVFKVYFKKDTKAMKFQSALLEWETHKELANLDGVELDSPDPQRVPNPEDLTRYLLSQYHPSESESPCQSLHQLASYRLSVPVTASIDSDDPLLMYQAVDVCVGSTKHYKCHLKDKATFKNLQNKDDNVVAASWPFHQMLDGLNVVGGIPTVKLSVANEAEHPSAAHAGRFRVNLRLEFLTLLDANSFVGRPNLSQRIDDLTWQVTVFVKDKKTFRECVEWKGENTQTTWDRMDVGRPV